MNYSIDGTFDMVLNYDLLHLLNLFFIINAIAKTRDEILAQ